MQRKLSSFDIYVITSELQNFVGYHVEKIYQLSRSEILIRIKNIKTKQKDSLFIKNGDFICKTITPLETPSKPSTFAITLRKYLQNGKISDISQHEFDRIIKIKISKKEGEYTLVIEFFSDGNIILVDPNGKIILPLIRQSWAHRSIKGREPYVPPPSQLNPFELNKERFTEIIKSSNTDLVRTLAVNLNLSGLIAEEICERALVDKKLKIEEINNETIKKTFNSFTKFLEIFKEKKFEPTLVKKDDIFVDIIPFKFKTYKKFDFEKIENMIIGLEKFIKLTKVEEKKKENKNEELNGKLNRQLKQQQETIKKFEKEIELKKIEGDLIYLHYQECEKLLEEIKKTLELKEKQDEINKINEKEIVKKFDPTDNILILKLKDTQGKIFEIKLNFRKTVSENAEKAYNDNKKLRSKLHGAEESIKKTKKQIELVKKEEKLKQEKTEKKVKQEKKHWFEKYRWFISSDGNIVIGGRDAKTNDIIVKKYLKERDRYVHADIQGAPSIIVKSKGIEDKTIKITEKTIEEACVFAASYSKAWKQFAEAQVYWVLPEQVSKTAQSGEFVPKGAFIIRGKRNYKKCKLEIAVGVIEIDHQRKVMGGPVNAVKKSSNKYVILNPGDIKKNVIAHKLAKIFDLSVDNVDRALPPGGVSVTKAEGFDL